MKVLIIYATTEGQTRKISEHVADQLREAGHEVALRHCADWQSDFHIGEFDRVILAGSVHQKRHQRELEIFVPAHLSELAGKPTLFISVSLFAAYPDGMAEAQTYVDEFLETAKWRPSGVVLAAGALRYDEYDYFMEQIVRHVVLEGREDAGSRGEHEFTDWKALSDEVNAFVDPDPA